jgi:hypothetical protein
MMNSETYVKSHILCTFAYMTTGAALVFIYFDYLYLRLQKLG